MVVDMATIYDCSNQSELLTGMRLARAAIGRGDLIVMPTDTVYGVAADAFNSDAVLRLLDAKNRTTASPPPVLVPGIPTLDALAESVPDEVRALVKAFWPGGLTVILPARDSLKWNLGETDGTVALRMPDDPIALEILSETGPLAVSSANLTGEPAAMTAQDAERMLGESVIVYLDGGSVGTRYPNASDGTGSTIVDATTLGRPGGAIRIVRHGVISDEAINEVLDAMPKVSLARADLVATPPVGAAGESDAAPAAAKKAPTKKAPAAKAAAAKTPAKKAPAKTPAKMAPAKSATAKASATKAPATKAPATKAPATKAPATKASATKAPATKASAAKAPAKSAAVAKSAVAKAPAARVPAAKAPAETSTAKASATRAPAKKAPAAKAPAKKASATKTASSKVPGEATP
jgi:tRNA threonylcarbamoyl adenosine modification protein (Sua5/YciO/YrdC/YwlC family)